MIKLIFIITILLILPFYPVGTNAEAAATMLPGISSGTGMKQSSIISTSTTKAQQALPINDHATNNSATTDSNASTIVADPPPEPINTKQLWQTVEENIEDVDFDAALETLEIIRNYSKHYQDDENLTKSLLTMVGLYIQNTDYESGLDLLYESGMPTDINLRALVIMLRAYCLRHYFQENAFILEENVEQGQSDDFRSWSKMQIINACLEDFYHAWQHRIYLGVEAYDKYVDYFKYWNIVFGAGPTVRDYLTYAMADFLADPSAWSEEEYKRTKKLNSAKMKSEPFKYAKQIRLRPETLSHPIEQIIYIFRDLANWHEDSSALSKAVQARNRCTVLVKRAFRKHHMATQSLKNIQNTFSTDQALPDDLETIKNNLKRRLSW